VVLFASACIEARRWKFYTERMLPGSKSVHTYTHTPLSEEGWWNQAFKWQQPRRP